MSMTVDPNMKTREEKDAELDRRIEALRKKNEALMKRHKEIEADRMKAEEDGISVTNRKPKHETEHDRKWGEKEILTVTVDLSKSPTEKRMANDRKTVNSSRGNLESPGKRPWTSGPHSPGLRQAADRGSHLRSPGSRPDRTTRADHQERSPRGFSGHESPGGEHPNRGGRTRRGRGGGGGGGGVGGGGGDSGACGTGSASPQDRRVKEWEEKRRQNIEKMNEEMEKIAEYERSQMDGSGEKNPFRNFLDDPRRLGSLPDSDRKDGSRRHIRNWGGPDFDKVKTGLDRDKDWQGRRSGSKGSVDMTMSMTGRERAEYMRWKKEREQIDQERLARHRNATGQWRREWDAEKTESMFKDNPSPTGNFEGGSRRDDRRPPKLPTVSDFISQSRSRDSRRGRDKRGGKNYSMHDNRWETCEGEHEQKQISEQQQEKEFQEKPVQDLNLNELKADMEESPVDEADDEDEWEDASDGEEEIVGEDVSDSEGELEGTKAFDDEEKKDVGRTKEEVEMGVEVAQHTNRSPEIGAKEQRARKSRETPKLHIPPKDVAVQLKETGSKPLSPFSLDGHYPVKDWAEEMETSSPRSNVEQSPLQTANTTKDSPPECKENVEIKPGGITADGESHALDVQTEKEPVSVTDQSPLQDRSGSNNPAGEIPKERVEPDTGDRSSDAATILAAQAATEEALKQQEVNKTAGDALEPIRRTAQSMDCVEDNEPSSG
ncbi:coiled-coil domain-containing protein 9 [Carcharodon carcharias]|uniref:coiled-coil domain-containing protein 9 n=1 Tax=Carcharodon carcharias TaxID=13397 RepID=UPI001B7E148F|nr:coiled-coil domain-containing protein 9 [Carcharodon carcharias]XP_041035390.1 coiled-coil domain-containing protein 9 [Carcharodon carcharias]XP_041035391.1 coiled-coil domain-containing protein 9 [Carcharodon carcharias]XP_041035392.1 coiled-coil domain-containing protein 9 [Carcharodon carcharias]XP_041035393.1 coiled-coil domain-containing protein 9 [Carcharodon carcharias]